MKRSRTSRIAVCKFCEAVLPAKFQVRVVAWLPGQSIHEMPWRICSVACPELPENPQIELRQ